MARGREWSAPETLYMMGLVEQILPFEANQWNAVQLQYNAELPNGFAACDADSIKRKFYALKNTRKPTGDPNYPPLTSLKLSVYIASSRVAAVCWW
ncbi:hypothetical protein PF008_g17453 [Phytophthora fragariae]|uniref:DUF6818 domain-containing protein n=1 Tax=Phytophthora fragariae TaxID=53985 RepID=A0A6G0R9K7_9STRA|nr:hypothetical protein PF008_g17453 [Phytophthora fragariae]